MMLNGDSTNKRFRLFAVSSERCLTIPDDFGPEDLALFSAVSASIVHRTLHARLTEPTGAGDKRKNESDARHVINAYISEETT
jgi:hypothetical protein